MSAQIDSTQSTVETANKNPLYPIFLKLEEFDLLLVGAGNVALEKVQSVLRNSPNTRVSIVAPLVREEFRSFVSDYSNVTIHERAYQETDLEGKDLIICATDNQELHVQIREQAHAKNLLVNVADTPLLCDFYLGSIVQKGYLKMAISTNGKSPTVAKRVKEVLNDAFPNEIDDLIGNINKVRATLNGDFNNKVRKLNKLTSSLVDDQELQAKKWKKVASYTLAAFGFMVLGHLLFSYFPYETIGASVTKLYKSLDANFPIMLLAGFIAQLVDGALGMGYGVTSATVLMSAGVSPAAISGSIHTAETFASGVSGYSHYKFGNVNMKLFKALVIPGVLGAVAGAILLTQLGDKYGNYVRPFIAIYTLFLGIKFIINAFKEIKPQKKIKRYSVLAAVGGFFDSFGGGGWGPIVTSTLINRGRNHRFAVGTVSLTEFFVTVSSAFTFFTMIGLTHWQTIVGLIIGGTIAAPIAAKLAGKLPRKTAFLLLGALVIFWSARILIKLF
ncbi:MAG: TSUP family transporter [Chitinophagaceae bacterium]|nr:TSUP family transporter [Chitinophagaceae bacterium]